MKTPKKPKLTILSLILTAICVLNFAGMFVINSAHAVTMRCDEWQFENIFDQRKEQLQQNTSGDHSIEGISTSYFRCETRKGHALAVSVSQYGPNAFWDLNERHDGYYRITCPLISESRLMKVLERRKKLVVGGLTADVGLLFGVEGGVAVNSRGAFCTISFAGVAVGGGVSGTRIMIREAPTP